MVRGGGRGAPLPPLGPCFPAGTAPSRVLRPRVGQCACPGRGAGLERGAGAEDGVAESAGPPASPAGVNRGSSGGGGGGGGSGSGGGDGSRSAARRGDGTAAQPGKRRAYTCCPLQAGGVDRLLRLAAAPEPLSRVLEPPGWRGLGTVRSVCLACARVNVRARPGRRVSISRFHSGAGRGWVRSPGRAPEGPCGPAHPVRPRPRSWPRR